MLTLANPWWLIALPLIMLLWLLASRLSQSSATETSAVLHPQTALLLQLQQQTSKRSFPWLWLLGCALLITALTRPQWLSDEPHQGRNFMLALDISSSMKAQDFQDPENQNLLISRMDMVKRVVDQFIAQRQGDRIGLVIFGDDAFTLAPMTTDLNLLRDHLSRLEQGSAGQRTALGNAIALGVKRLQNQDKQSRSLILLTDGSNTAGDIHPLNALKLAQHYDVRIYPIGIGSNKQVVFPRMVSERPDFKVVPLDEALLQTLATESGGQYYRASAPGELKQIIQDIEQIETVPLEAHLTKPTEWYGLPLAIGLALILIHAWRKQHGGLPC